MKHLLYILSFSMVLYSCGESSEAELKNDTSEVKSDTVAPIVIDIVLDKTESIPSECVYSGKIIDIHTWSDLNGKNYFVRTLGEIEKASEANEADYFTATQYLYAYHYKESAKGDIKLLKETTDFVKDCEFDLIISHELDALVLTDLDENEIGEITFVYRTHCTSDVSPSTQKLIMLQDGKKYPLRGTTRVYEYGGEYSVGEEFNDAPASFLEHAKTIWSEHLTEYDFEL